MTDSNPMSPQPGHLAIVEMDGVGQPDALIQPATLLKEVDSVAAMLAAHKIGFRPRLDQMGMEAAAGFPRHPGGLGKQFKAHVKKRIWRQGHSQHRAIRAVMVALEDAGAVVKYRIGALDHLAGRHRLFTVAGGEVQPAARQRHS